MYLLDEMPHTLKVSDDPNQEIYAQSTSTNQQRKKIMHVKIIQPVLTPKIKTIQNDKIKLVQVQNNPLACYGQADKALNENKIELPPKGLTEKRFS